MKFNYAAEKLKFVRKQEQLAKQYRQAGMSEEAIQKMYEFDYEMFKQERTFCVHNQYMISGESEDDDFTEESNSLMMKFMDKFSTEFKADTDSTRFGWLEGFNNESFYEFMCEMKESDLELITLIVIEGYSVVEIARIQRVTHQSISKKWNRIRNHIKNFLLGVAD